MNIINSVKENFSSEKWNTLSTPQKISMTLSLITGLALLLLLFLKKVVKGHDYLTPMLHSLGADGFVAIVATIYILVGGLQFGS